MELGGRGAGIDCGAFLGGHCSSNLSSSPSEGIADCVLQKDWFGALLPPLFSKIGASWLLDGGGGQEP